MGRERKPSAKARAASEVVKPLEHPSPKSHKKRSTLPPVAPTTPIPALSVAIAEARREIPAPSEYEEVPSSSLFQPLSAATITSSPCKTVPQPSPSSTKRAESPRRSSPSILLRKRSSSFDGRIQMMGGTSDKLPTLDPVAPPVIKPEMIEEAKFLQAARALQQYASSGEETDDDEEDHSYTKRARYTPVEKPNFGSGNIDVSIPAPISEVSEEEKPSNIKNVLMAMASTAAEEQPKSARVPPALEKTGSALSLLARTSRPSSTEPGATSDYTVSPEGDGVEGGVKSQKGALEPNMTDMVSFLTELKQPERVEEAL